MLRNVLINRWILGSVVLLIIVAVSCYFWYQHEISPYEEEVAKADDLVHQKQIINETETENKTNASFNSTSTDEDKVSDEDIEKIAKEVTAEGKVSGANLETLLEWISAEEEQVKKSLSAEELRKRDAKKRVKELFKEIEAIMKDAGGKIHSSTHPEEWRRISALLQEASGGSTAVFTQMNDFTMRFQNSVNSNGEMLVSEAIKMADYMESENGDTFSATALRNLVQYTVNNGNDVINLNGLHKIDISGKPTDNSVPK